MKKNCVLLYAITLLIAFCFTQSMMAEKKSYMGYHYNGKINKENILEGEDVPKLKSQRNKIILEVDNFTMSAGGDACSMLKSRDDRRHMGDGATGI